MSVPAHGGMSLYRNPIEEVARFFRVRHADCFLIYNCTTECYYPIEFFQGKVCRIAVEDHNVPTLKAIVAFCRECDEITRRAPETVIAVHCRGGKGRTGLMVCAWLLWKGASCPGEPLLSPIAHAAGRHRPRAYPPM